MDENGPTEFFLEAFADPASVRDVVRGILHTIFFHRFFPSIVPRTHDVLDLALPWVDDVELETLIEQHVANLARQLDSERSGGSGLQHRHQSANGGRGQIAVRFFEKRRRKAAWFSAGGDEEVCWEVWTVKVTVAEPRTENERAKLRRAISQTLMTTAMKIVTAVNANRDHISPITTNDSNPFPYHIAVNHSTPSSRAHMVSDASRTSSPLSSIAGVSSPTTVVGDGSSSDRNRTAGGGTSGGPSSWATRMVGGIY